MWGDIKLLAIFINKKIAFAGLDVSNQIQNVKAGDLVAITQGQKIKCIGRVKKLEKLSSIDIKLSQEYADVDAIVFDDIHANEDYPDMDFGTYGGQGKKFHECGDSYAASVKLNYDKIMKTKKFKDIINILKYKHQIILQGPPGTGKTREAKLLAKEMLGLNEINELEHSDEFEIIQFHPSYAYEDFVRGIVSKPNEAGDGIIYEAEDKVLGAFAKKALDNYLDNKKDTSSSTVNLKNYVLIVDEINRANLSSVLGELIYALEYRGESVDSMYSIDGDNKLVLPPNLYIIGTMNTADRSVGHIDYAIRRRFAFIDILPQQLSDTDKIFFNSSSFDAVEKLFDAGLVSNEFEVKDVQIGHSYFIAEKKDITNHDEKKAIFSMKMEYEIKPILREYLKDGIFIENGKIEGKSIKEYINELI